MEKWEYRVLNLNMADRWSAKKAAAEIEAFQKRLNAAGEDGWEMISYESVPLYGSFTKNLKGHAYLLFLKRRIVA